MFGLRDCQVFGFWIELVRVGIEISPDLVMWRLEICVLFLF